MEQGSPREHLLASPYDPFSSFQPLSSPGDVTSPPCTLEPDDFTSFTPPDYSGGNEDRYFYQVMLYVRKVSVSYFCLDSFIISLIPIDWDTLRESNDLKKMFWNFEPQRETTSFKFVFAEFLIIIIWLKR